MPIPQPQSVKQAVSCGACGSTNNHKLLDPLSHEYVQDGIRSTWAYTLLECRQCGLGWIDPLPDNEMLQTFYPQSYGCYAPPVVEGKSLKFALAKAKLSTDSGLLSRWGKRAAATLIEVISGRTISFTLSVPLQFPTTATFLELGYGSGSWLLSMSQRGYTHLWGYDIEANAEGKQRLEDRGVTVSSGLFLENDYPQEYFDCIRLEHVFEHLAAPQAVLEKCHRLLKPGGALVLSLPSKGSWSFALEPRYCASLDVPRHLFHHTEASVALMLDRAGFSGVVAKSYPVIMVLGASINNQLGDKNLPKVPVMFFQLLGPIYRAFAYIAGRGEFMTVLAYK